MKRATCLIAVLFLSILLPGIARADCDGPPVPKVTVRIDRPPVREDRSMGLTALNAIPSDSRRAGMEEYKDTLGIADAELSDSAVHIDLITTDAGNGVYCTRMRSAEASMSWTTTVFIAAEIKPGSCLDKATSEHEQGHVRIDEKLIPIARRAVEVALTAVGERGVTGGSVKESQSALEQQATAAVKEALAIFTVVRKRQQLAHDSKEEYDRLSNACGILEYVRLLRDAHKKAGV